MTSTDGRCLNINSEDRRIWLRLCPEGTKSCHLILQSLIIGVARNGDRAAFGRLYDRYAQMVHGVLLAKVPAGEVDDLVQDVFVMALRRFSMLHKMSRSN